MSAADDFLRADAEAKYVLVRQGCRVAHEHGPIPCYEARYGIHLSARPRETHRILERDRPLYASPDFSADPADVAVAREELADALERAAREERSA